MVRSGESVEMRNGVVRKNHKRVQLAADIFAEHGSAIRAIIQSQVGSDYEADDVFQDFFLSLVHRPVPRHIRDVRRYLFRAIKNDIIDASRQTQSCRARLRKYAERAKYRPAMNGPVEKVIRSDQIERLFDVVRNELCHQEAQAITHRYRYGGNTAEAATMMGVNKRSVSRYVCVGLRKLREVLAADERAVQDFC